MTCRRSQAPPRRRPTPSLTLLLAPRGRPSVTSNLVAKLPFRRPLFRKPLIRRRRCCLPIRLRAMLAKMTARSSARRQPSRLSRVVRRSRECAHPPSAPSSSWTAGASVRARYWPDSDVCLLDSDDEAPFRPLSSKRVKRAPATTAATANPAVKAEEDSEVEMWGKSASEIEDTVALPIA